jgi:hypothetical protein
MRGNEKWWDYRRVMDSHVHIFWRQDTPQIVISSSSVQISELCDNHWAIFHFSCTDVPLQKGDPSPIYVSFRYRWLASKWSSCVVTSDKPTVGPKLVEVVCGGGVQLREVTCVQASQGSQPVSPELCESLEPLPTVQRSVPQMHFIMFSLTNHFCSKNLWWFTTIFQQANNVCFSLQVWSGMSTWLWGEPVGTLEFLHACRMPFVWRPPCQR